VSEAAVVCANHPERETSLRCNRCGKPICSRCAVLTPVGYRCRECVRGQQAVFETAKPFDYAAALAIAAVGIGLATRLLGFLGFWGLLASPIAGGAIAEAVRWATGRRRSRRLPLFVGIGAALGVLANLLTTLAPFAIALLIGGRGIGLDTLGGMGLRLLLPVLYGVLTTGTLLARLRGIRI